LEKNGSMRHCMSPWEADFRPNRAAVMGFTRRSHDAIIPVVSSPLLMTVDFFFLLLQLSLGLFRLIIPTAIRTCNGCDEVIQA
jgi:hypothetical protein